MKNKEICLIGAGLAGSLLAIYLARLGAKVTLFERRPDMRKSKISAGRSINLAISTRGIHALEQVELSSSVLARAIPMRGRVVHSLNTDLKFAPYGKNDSEFINAISRSELNIALLNALDNFKNVKVLFNQRCTGISLESGKVEVDLLDEERHSSQKFVSSLVIGTDGSASAVRAEFFKTPRFNFSQTYLEHSYKELIIPRGKGAEFLIEKNALHIWPRGGYMMIALPNLDGSFTCTLFLAQSGKLSFESLDTVEKVQSFYKEQFPDATALMPTLTHDFFTNPTGGLVTVKCFPWHIEDKVLLLGDAAHAIVPFYGQGANCAFEDIVYLDQCLKQQTDLREVFAQYEQLRKPNTDAIADLAIDNFYEMRDLVADPKFLLKKKLEHLLEEKYPNQFISKYSMVTFNRIPYLTALEKGRRQDKIIDAFVSKVSTIEQIDLAKVFAEVNAAG